MKKKRKKKVPINRIYIGELPIINRVHINLP